jgi:hypothetical protein
MTKTHDFQAKVLTADAEMVVCDIGELKQLNFMRDAVKLRRNSDNELYTITLPESLAQEVGLIKPDKRIQS